VDPRAAAGRKRKVDDLAQLLLPFSSLLVVRNTITCNHQQNHNTVDFSFLFHCFQIRLPPFSSFRTVSFFLSSRFATFSFFRWQIWWRRVAVDADGSAGAWGLRCGGEGGVLSGAGSVSYCFAAVACVRWTRYGEERGC